MRSAAAYLLLIALAVPFIARAQTDTAPAAAPTASKTTDVSLSTSYSSAYAFQRQGVFGCNLNGSYSMSVGALSATGGVFVPVNDAAVTLNTGYLVYKECVLRGIVDRMRESASSALQKQIINAYERGRNGQPLFSQSIPLEQRDVADAAVMRSLQDGTLSTVHPAFRSAVMRGVGQGYMAARNAANQNFACPYAGNLGAALNGRPVGSFWEAESAFLNPACSPYHAYVLANTAVMASVQGSINNMMTQLQWGQGTYPRTVVDPVTGETIVVTPASIVQSNTLQALQTGFRQLENANDIDQMVGALFAGITSQVVGDNRGLAGLTQTTGGQPSYLDQVAKESAQGVRDSAVNAAIQILTASRQVEAGYKAAMDAIGTLLANTIDNIRGKETACWNLIIQKVCSGALKADGTCAENVGACVTDPATGVQTCPTGATLKVATSTVFSQRVVNASIAPLASTTAANIRASSNALAQIDQLIRGVTNTTSLNAQRVALQQLDALVAQKTLHTQYDMQGAQQQQQTVADTMAQLIQDTVTAWADSTDTQTGWCNVNRAEVTNAWKDCWRQGSTSCVYPR